MYLSISYCIKDDRHIRIRILVDKLPAKIGQSLLILSDLIFMAFMLAVTWYGHSVIERSLKLGQIAPAMEIPVACLYASVLVCAVLSVIRLGVSIKKRVLSLFEPSKVVQRFSSSRYIHLKAKHRTSNRLLELQA